MGDTGSTHRKGCGVAAWDSTFSHPGSQRNFYSHRPRTNRDLPILRICLSDQDGTHKAFSTVKDEGKLILADISIVPALF